MVPRVVLQQVSHQQQTDGGQSSRQFGSHSLELCQRTVEAKLSNGCRRVDRRQSQPWWCHRRRGFKPESQLMQPLARVGDQPSAAAFRQISITDEALLQSA